jgi:subtilisin family serine protease
VKVSHLRCFSSEGLRCCEEGKNPVSLADIASRSADIVAPGNRVVSVLGKSATQLGNAYPQNVVSKAYLVLSGTSMASGVVSGAVADLLQANPALPPDQLKAILMASASKTFPQYSSTHDPATGITYVSQYDAFTIGAGYLDLQNVLAEVSNPPLANAPRSAVRNRGRVSRKTFGHTTTAHPPNGDARTFPHGLLAKFT